MRISLATLSICAVLYAAPAAAQQAQCEPKDGKPQVFVKAKTPIRKGPGLNYQVSSFLEEGVCLPFSEVSMDKRWVLVTSDEIFGWVPMGRLDPVSQAGAQAGAPVTASVGSGQARGKVRIIEQTIMLNEPREKAAPKRIMPRDLMVVPLSTTPDGRWVEVVDERGATGWVLTKWLRGDAIADLPVNEKTKDMPVLDPAEPGVRIIRVRPGRSGVGVALTAAVYGGAFAPVHSLDSNGANGRRRYDIQAFAPSTGIELEMFDLGPLAARLAYTTAFVTGVEAEDGSPAGGNQHDLQVRAALPFEVGPATLSVEAGYHLAMFDFDQSLADGYIAFLSTTAHVGTVGGRLRWFLDKSLLLEADGGVAFGVTSTGPALLSQPEGGGTLGAYGAVGVQYFIGDIIGVAARYMVDWRRASFTGAPAIDPTLTEGTVTDLNHGLLVGLSFLLAG